MIIESARIALGVTLVCFHRPIAQFMHSREQALAAYMGSKGVRLPSLSAAALTDAYFFIGVGATLLAVASLWLPV